MSNSYNHPATPPDTSRKVKLLIVCPNKGKNWNQTTTGYYLPSQGYKIDDFEGDCYKVVGWAELNSNTENYGTETI